MDSKNKLTFKSFIFVLLMMLPLLFYVDYLQDAHEEELRLFGDTTVGITYKYTTGKNSFIHYHYKVNGKIYHGASVPGIGQYPGFYYEVTYSTKNPEESDINWNISIPDSIGKKVISLDEFR